MECLETIEKYVLSIYKEKVKLDYTKYDGKLIRNAIDSLEKKGLISLDKFVS